MVKSFIASIIAGLAANAITVYAQGDFKVDAKLIPSLVYVIFVLILSVWVFKRSKTRISQEVALGNEAVLKDIALNQRNHSVAFWCYGRTNGYSTVQTNHTWQEWIDGLITATKRPDLTPYDFGKEYYFFDLSSCKKIKIPTGNDARRIRVGETLRPGMVLRLMPNKL